MIAILAYWLKFIEIESHYTCYIFIKGIKSITDFKRRETKAH